MTTETRTHDETISPDTIELLERLREHRGRELERDLDRARARRLGLGRGIDVVAGR